VKRRRGLLPVSCTVPREEEVLSSLIRFSRALAPASVVIAIAGWACGIRLPFLSPGHAKRISELRADLIGALGTARLSEARLAGFGYAPFPGSGAASCKGCTAVVGAIRQRAEHQPSAATLSDYGVVKVAANKLAEAVGLLQQAVARRPGDEVALNDLAAVFIAEARAEHRPLLLLQALEALAGTDDSSPEARFNHALVLERLQLRSEARKAWRRCLAAEPDPGWRREARLRLTSLEAPTRAAEWRAEQPLLEAAVQRGDLAAVDGIVNRFHQEVRSLAQERLLPAWGTSYLHGDGVAAAQALGAARLVGAALMKLNGDRSVADAMAAIERASGNPSLSAALARGHMAYGSGVTAYLEPRIGEARTRFAEAKRGFREGGNVAAGWVDLWLAALDYYEGRHSDAVERLDPLLASSEIRRYPALRGRALWERGLVEMEHMAIDRSLVDLQAALREFESAGELENGGALNFLVAENFEMLGELEEAWRYREQALAALKNYPDSIWLHNLLVEASRALLRQGLVHAALAFQDEDLMVARRRGRPVTLVEALLLKARLEAQLGDEGQASRDLEEAGASVAAVADVKMRQRMRIESLVARSQVVGARQPAAVVGLLTQAIAYYQAARVGNLVAPCYLLRARARLELRDDLGAEGDLRAGIGAYEAARSSLTSEWRRATYLEQWQPLFDEMILLLAARRHKPEEALAFAERAKVGLLCRVGGGGQSARSADESFCRSGGRASLLAIQRALPERAALVEYALLPDRVLIWVVRRSAFALAEHPVKADEVPRLVEDLLLALRDGRPPDGSRQAGAALFEQLVRPIAAWLAEGDRLILVPDKELSAVPFAALYDAARRSYLVERWPLSVEPSASFYAAKRSLSDVPPRQWRLLAVAPAQSAGVEALGALQGAASEAAATAALYPRHRLLTGAEATSVRFLAALRNADAVEFAGHAIADPQEPPLSRLVLAPDPAAAGSSMLFARELRQMSLGHLRLVVLSACATAPGSRARGEGVSGIAQAFLEAGAPAVLATLWRVDDAAARRMVLEFHRRLLAGEDGASAVRSAQLALLRDRDEALRQPSGWAAFELVGALLEPET
jgi:CHAT domain-containing protein/tetratricopeptide (TPR) repeat protein